MVNRTFSLFAFFYSVFKRVIFNEKKNSHIILRKRKRVVEKRFNKQLTVINNYGKTFCESHNNYKTRMFTVFYATKHKDGTYMNLLLLKHAVCVRHCSAFAVSESHTLSTCQIIISLCCKWKPSRLVHNGPKFVMFASHLYVFHVSCTCTTHASCIQGLIHNKQFRLNNLTNKTLLIYYRVQPVHLAFTE